MNDRPLFANARLVEAVRAIEASRRRICVVIDADQKLLGTLTDGDVRRCLLNGGNLDTPVSEAMNTQPATALQGSPEGYLLDLMRRRNIMAVPLIDACGRFLRAVHLADIAPAHEVIEAASGFAFAVIMAGGEGSRLRPLTHKIPKPMVEVDGVPILERQIRRLAEAQIERVYISVNYLSHVIEEHFNDGQKFGIEVQYLREREKLGTAGALSLLPEQPHTPIVVMNGDILTMSNFGSLYTFHQAQGAAVTVAAIDYRVNIPFGVLCSDGPYVTELVEKPSQRFLCNAGIYAVSPDALPLIPIGRSFNMTDLITVSLQAHHRVAVFPLHEYWSDVGTPDDLEKARAFFAQTMR